jgi:hypothetical protein
VLVACEVRHNVAMSLQFLSLSLLSLLSLCDRGAHSGTLNVSVGGRVDVLPVQMRALL